jgi:aldose sugar dehydrogenase
MGTLTLLAALTVSCEWVPSGFGPPGQSKVKAEFVAWGLEVPWSLAFLPSGDMLVTERPGRLRVVHDGRLVPEPVATVSTSRSGEGGLLGLALHPQFAQNRLFYLYVTGEKQVNRVERWRLREDGLRATRDRVIVDGIASADFHDGGRLRFGPDGMLYIATGDGRVPDRARDWNSLNGKLLRVTPDGEPAPGNPRPGNRAFLTGIRNLEAFDWITPSRLVLADNGPSGELLRTGQDEVDVAHRGDDLGWPAVSGCSTKAGTVAPLLSWKDAVPPGGGALYTGTRIPGWKGSFIIGTLGSQHLHRVIFDAAYTRVLAHEVYLPQLGRLRDVVMGPDGELYVTTSNCDGRGQCPATRDAVLRIVPAE